VKEKLGTPDLNKIMYEEVPCSGIWRNNLKIKITNLKPLDDWF